MNVWLVGSGGMARDYAKVLSAQKVSFTVIGRGEDSAAQFERQSGHPVCRGGLQEFLANQQAPLPDAAIVSVGVEALASTTTALINAGVKRILVEKPAGMTVSEIGNLNALAHTQGAQVFVAYNRRFYRSVRRAREIIQEDGGVLSFNFEFTEWAQQITPLMKAPGVKQHWLLGNSSHVIDLAFYLGGSPEDLHSLRGGGLAWHPSGSIFVGSGRTDCGALFSFQANWGSPGRWGVEVCTANHRLIFRPIETLQFMKQGSIIIENVVLSDEKIDKDFKPGLFFQAEAFLKNPSTTELCQLHEHAKNAKFYSQMGGY